MRNRFTRIYVVLGFLFILTGVQLLAVFPGRPLLAWGAALVCYALMVPWQFAYRMGKPPVGSRRLLVAAWAGNLTLGFWGTFLMLSAAGGVGYGLASGLSLVGTVTYPQVGLITLWISFCVACFGWLETVIGPRVKSVTVPLPAVARALHGLTIVQISDLHVGSTIRRRYVAKVVRRVKALNPDIIAFTGDFGDGPADLLKEEWKGLKELTAPLGKYYVTGNHEYYWNGEDWTRAARDCGFTALTNESRVLEIRGAKLTVAGVTDHAAAYFNPRDKRDLAQALRGGEQGDYKILLAHQPSGFEEAEKAGFDLQLSGHTHGGQFIPFFVFMPFAHQYHRGLNRIGKLLLYINVGTGYWGPPNRFGIPSEISFLTLTAGD